MKNEDEAEEVLRFKREKLKKMKKKRRKTAKKPKKKPRVLFRTHNVSQNRFTASAKLQCNVKNAVTVITSLAVKALKVLCN